MIVRSLIAKLAWQVDDSDLKKNDKFVKDLFNWAKVAAAAAAAAMAAFAKSAVDKQLEFEAGLSRLQTLLPGQTAQVEAFAGDIRRLAQETGSSVGTLTDALYEQLSALGAAADSTEILDTVARASMGAGTDAKNIVNLLTAVGLAYQDTSAKALASTNDMAFQAVALGKTSYEELAAGIGQVSGAAVQLGVTQQELFAIMGTAAGVTGPTSQVFTQLKATMTNLAAPTAELKKVYKQLGITAIEREVGEKGLVPTLQRIIEATDGSVAATAKLFASDEARGLILPMLSKLQDRYRVNLEATTRAEGAARTAYDASRGGMAKNAQKAKELEARFAELQLVLGGKLTPDLLAAKELMVDWTTVLVDQFLPAWGLVRDGFTDANVEADAFNELLSGIAAGARVVAAVVGQLANQIWHLLQYMSIGYQWMTDGWFGAAQGEAALGAKADAERARFDRLGSQLQEYAFDNEAFSNKYRMRGEKARYQEMVASTVKQTVQNVTLNGNWEMNLPPGTTSAQAADLRQRVVDDLLRGQLARAVSTRAVDPSTVSESVGLPDLQ